MPIIQREDEVIAIPKKLPLIPLREIVVFPFMVVPLIIAREGSVKALEKAVAQDRLVFLAAQRNAEIENPTKDDVYRTGVVARVLQVLRLPSGMIRALVEGVVRARVARFLSSPAYLQAAVEVQTARHSPLAKTQARLRSVLAQFTDYVKLNRQVPDEVLLSLNHVDDPQRLADTMAAYLIQTPSVKQRLIEAPNLIEQLEELSSILAMEVEILEIKTQIDGEVRDRIQKTQREFFLQEQMKVIKQELGEADEQAVETAELRRSIADAQMSKPVEEKALAELEKLQRMHPTSPESTVVRNYLDWLITVPWAKRTEDNQNLEDVERILEADHYGLTKPKERILEYLAVVQLTKAIKGPILCFVGPPGVGKTSLGKSIARAMGRKFVRMSLGGVRDEAEIRGHRRTYIGAMPGRIIQGMRRAGTVNPVVLLDEIDKIGLDFRGDPAAALLEVLDPEQNHSFNDHYLDVDYDLSHVLFITTANTVFSIPPALRDRMEIIHLPGYLEHEKLAIAKAFLVPKQLEANGLQSARVTVADETLLTIIRAYTREAGVRNLEREIAAICRKIARKVVQGDRRTRVRVSVNQVRRYLGMPKFQEPKRVSREAVGVATGLAWTEVGGELLTIEVSLLRRNGEGRLTLTGHLGDVMQESAQAALSFARARATAMGLDTDFYRDIEVHIHVPEGSIPKDGPSAGMAIAAALCSALSGRPIRGDVAMTGEITLRGHILPIGGLNEKMLAAQRAGVTTVILPRRNENDLVELPHQVRRGITMHLVETMDEVLTLVLGIDSLITIPPDTSGRSAGAVRRPARA